MPPPPRAKSAIDAMKSMGFSRRLAALALRKLLDVYEDEYNYIEENGYQVLIDKILEEQESNPGGGQEQDSTTPADPEPTRKRLRKLSEIHPSSESPGEPLLKIPKPEPGVFPELESTQEGGTDFVSQQVNGRGNMVGVPSSSQPSVGVSRRDATAHTTQEVKTTDTISPQSPSHETHEHASAFGDHRQIQASGLSHKMSADEESPLNSTSLIRKSRKKLAHKEPKIEPGLEIMPETVVHTLAPRSKDRGAADAADRTQCASDPITMIGPSNNLSSAGNKAYEDEEKQDDASANNSALNIAKWKGKAVVSDIPPAPERSTSVIDVASCDTGEVKLMFRVNPHCDVASMPSVDSIVKTVEERYKALQPDFSLMKVLKEMCQCAVELNTGAVDG